MLYGAMNSPLRPVLEEIKVLADLEFDYLELAMDPPCCDARNLRRRKHDILRSLKECNLRLIFHLPTFLSTADLTERIRKASIQETLASLEVAAEMKPLKVVLHPSYMMGLATFAPDLAKAHAMESLEIIVGKAQSLGLRLCLENMFPRTQWLIHPEEFVDILARFPTLNLLLDVGHAHLEDAGGKKCLRFIEMFAGRLKHLHVSDNFGKEDQHLPIGAGIIDFPKVVKALKGIGYNDTVTLEVFSRDRDYLKMSKKKIQDMFEK